MVLTSVLWDLRHAETAFAAAPVKIDARRRAEVREAHLYVSFDKGKTWNLADRTTPDKDKFTYNAPADGEYRRYGQDGELSLEIHVSCTSLGINGPKPLTQQLAGRFSTRHKPGAALRLEIL